MNKFELISVVAEKLDISKKDATKVLDCCLDTITETLKAGDKVQLVGFGSFDVRERAAREGRNPQKPEETIKIPSTKVPVFKAGRILKDAVK
ncbi:MAG: HU family DNA-binding protein [Clostridia bacterium]|jgi:DNA-binding protein HU-beta|nr:HU family DNA-binding protein [Clostridia bacterium]MBQ2273769.1 HU family DNA-binding protein [Clostridia bacterium]MBQ5820713.1 HU family DNA-binding protein [Clostridia bacterium]